LRQEEEAKQQSLQDMVSREEKKSKK
jgi:hypothetical protein